jgi:hypothetical protein
MYRYLTEIMREASYVIDIRADFKVVRFSPQQPQHGLIPHRTLQAQDRM